MSGNGMGNGEELLEWASAGAIAAAVTAAAEYVRERGGFDRLLVLRRDRLYEKQ